MKEDFVVVLNECEIILNERKGKKVKLKKGEVLKVDKLPGKHAKKIKVIKSGKTIDVPAEILIKDFKDHEWQFHLKRAYVDKKTGILM